MYLGIRSRSQGLISVQEVEHCEPPSESAVGTTRVSRNRGVRASLELRDPRAHSAFKFDKEGAESETFEGEMQSRTCLKPFHNTAETLATRRHSPYVELQRKPTKPEPRMFYYSSKAFDAMHCCGSNQRRVQC